FEHRIHPETGSHFRVRWSSRSSGRSKDPSEDRIDVLGVIAEIEIFADILFGQGRAYIFVGKKFLKEISTLLPHLHGVSLHKTVSTLARDASLGERLENALQMDQAAKPVH